MKSSPASMRSALALIRALVVASLLITPVGADFNTVVDNGPGIPAETINGLLDVSVRVSSREAYVAPDRGSQE